MRKVETSGDSGDGYAGKDGLGNGLPVSEQNYRHHPAKGDRVGRPNPATAFSMSEEAKGFVRIEDAVAGEPACGRKCGATITVVAKSQLGAGRPNSCTAAFRGIVRMVVIVEQGPRQFVGQFTSCSLPAVRELGIWGCYECAGRSG